MYHHLKSLKDDLSNNHLFYFCCHLFFACVIYGCNTQNRSNVGDNTATSSFIACPRTGYINAKMHLKSDKDGNIPMHLACEKGDKEFVIATLKDLFSSKREEYIHKIFNSENNYLSECIYLAGANGHIDLLAAMFNLFKENKFKIHEVILESAFHSLQEKMKDTKKINNVRMIECAIAEINDYRNSLIQDEDMPCTGGLLSEAIDMPVHPGDQQPFECTQEGSGKRYSQRGHLTNDNLDHTGKKPFERPSKGSGKRFTRKVNRKKHMVTHIGKIPFECPSKCGYSCNTNYKLRKHMNVHTGEYLIKCDGCGIPYRTLNSLTTHRNKNPECYTKIIANQENNL